MIVIIYLCTLWHICKSIDKIVHNIHSFFIHNKAFVRISKCLMKKTATAYLKECSLVMCESKYHINVLNPLNLMIGSDTVRNDKKN